MNHIYYTGLTIEEFAADEYFQQWVLHPGAEHEQFWSSFQNLYPAEKPKISRARQLVTEIAAGNYRSHGLSLSEKAAIKNNIFLHIGEEINASHPATGNAGKKKYLPQVFAVAALFIMVFAGIYFFIDHDSSSSGSPIVLTTGVDEKKEIVLPDSSVVILNAKSLIRYNRDFPKGSNREVYLEGNAFFKVKRNALQQPFVVHANNLSVTVLGTEFNVNARSAATAIALVSGKVKVVKQGAGNKEENISPGEEIKLDTMHQELVRSKADMQLYTAWTEGKWNFQQTTLENIMTLVRSYYGTNAVFTNEDNKQLKISAVIPVTDANSLMQVISKTLGIKIEKNNNVFTIL